MGIAENYLRDWCVFDEIDRLRTVGMIVVEMRRDTSLRVLAAYCFS